MEALDLSSVDSSKDALQAFTKTGKPKVAKQGLKVHKCSCGKIFSRAEHLRRHELCHNNAFRFICPYNGCGRPFSRKDLFEKHQKRHEEPESRVGSTENTPGYSLIPIKISKQPDAGQIAWDSSLVLRARSDEYEIGDSVPCDGRESPYNFLPNIESSGRGHEKSGDISASQRRTSRESCIREANATRHLDEVQRSVGWNVDLFMRLPKLRDQRVNTVEIYHYCLKVLGRVGKSEDWVNRITENNLGFLSALTIASAHRDLLRGMGTESAVTLAVKSEVLQMLCNSTMLSTESASDLNFIAITQLLSCELIFGNREVCITHTCGLMSIANLRSGLKNLGWNAELGMIASAKVMILAVIHDFECPDMFLNETFSPVPHLPNLCQQRPESPACWQNEDLEHLKYAKYCSEETRAILVQMRRLTEQYLDSSSGCFTAPIEKPFNEVFQSEFDANSMRAKLMELPINTSDPYYEIVRLVSLVYTTALLECVPFADAASMISADLGETIAAYVIQTDIIACWQGDMAGVLTWSSLIASSVASTLTTQQGKKAAAWLRVTSLHCMILLSTEHASAFLENAKRLLMVQSMLRNSSRSQLRRTASGLWKSPRCQ